jgi:hypothetical protein
MVVGRFGAVTPLLDFHSNSGGPETFCGHLSLRASFCGLRWDNLTSQNLGLFVKIENWCLNTKRQGIAEGLSGQNIFMLRKLLKQVRPFANAKCLRYLHPMQDFA